MLAPKFQGFAPAQAETLRPAAAAAEPSQGPATVTPASCPPGASLGRWDPEHGPGNLHVSRSITSLSLRRCSVHTRLGLIVRSQARGRHLQHGYARQRPSQQLELGFACMAAALPTPIQEASTARGDNTAADSELQTRTRPPAANEKAEQLLRSGASPPPACSSGKAENEGVCSARHWDQSP